MRQSSVDSRKIRRQQYGLAISALATVGCVSTPSAPRQPIPGGELDIIEERATIRQFSLDAYEVSARHYMRCVRAGACTPPETEAERGCFERIRSDRHPIRCVHPGQAKDYCRWVGGRLPSYHEILWAVTNRERAQSYPWGNEPPSCDNSAGLDYTRPSKYFHLTRACSRRGTVPVNAVPQSASQDGVLHLLGNVNEWVTLGSGCVRFGGSYAEFSKHTPPWELHRRPRGGSFSCEGGVGSPLVGFRCAYD